MIPVKYMRKLTQPASSKKAPANRAMTGILAPHGMNGVNMAVARRSRSLRMVRLAITPGMAQPVPMTKGITDCRKDPLLENGSSTTETRDI
mgnify:CR=1 FL=1